MRVPIAPRPTGIGDGTDVRAAHTGCARGRRLPDGAGVAVERKPGRIRHFRYRRHHRRSGLPHRDSIPAGVHPARTLDGLPVTAALSAAEEAELRAAVYGIVAKFGNDYYTR